MLFSISNMYAQGSSSIKGTIKDKSGGGLAGANVKILNSNYGASTDLEGNYEIKNVPAGKHTLKVSYVGFKPITKSAVVSNNKATVVNFVLQDSDGVLDEVTIKGQSFKQKNSVTTVSTISTQKIKDLLMTVEQPLRMLERIPGVSMDNYGQGGVVDNYVIRGFKGAHSGGTGAEIDGISLNETGGHDGYSDINVSIPINISNIKLFKGPSSVLYGRFSQGGTLVLETRKGGEYSDLSLKVGSFRTIDAQYAQGSAIKLGKSDKVLQTNFASQVYRTDGYVTKHSQVLKGNVAGTISYAFNDKADISLSLRGHKSLFNAPGYVTKEQYDNLELRNTPNEYAENDGGERDFYSQRLGFNYKLSENIKLLLFSYALQQETTRFAKFKLDGFGGQAERGYKRDAYALGGSLNGNTKIGNKDFNWVAGAEYYYEDSELHRWNTTFRKRVNKAQDRVFDLHSVSLFVQGEVILHKLFKPTIGARYDTYSGDFSGNDPGKTKISEKIDNLSHISPKLGFRSTLTEGLDFRASASNGFSLPSRENKYTKKDLEPVILWQYEAGLSYNKDDKVDIDVAAFRIDRTKEIMTIRDSGVEKVVNVGETRRMGVEGQVEVELVKGLRARATGSYIDTEVIKNPANKKTEGKELRGIPNTTVSFGASYVSPGGLGLDFSYRNVGESFLDNDNLKTRDGYSVANATLFYDLKGEFLNKGKIFLSINNLFNNIYPGYASARLYSPAPTRNFSLGINYSF